MTAPPDVVTVGGRTITITNPDRVVWPVSGTTKREVVSYQLAIARFLLPYLRRRATMLWRFPEGVDGPGWFQANCRGRPDWLPVHEVTGRKGETLSYCLVEEPAALAWLANLGTIELHPHLWTIDAPTAPSWLVLDLDPGRPAGLGEAARVALDVRARLASAGLASGVKTSGGLGLHVVVPLAAGQTFGDTKAFARALAREAARERPELVVDRSVRAERAGRVYVDWIQNDQNRQLVAPYSLRATPVPMVSTPVEWDEVEAAARAREPREAEALLRFGPRQVLDRVGRLGDLLEAVSPGVVAGAAGA